jgi:predicted RNA-binding Zn ribbon-like protein
MSARESIDRLFETIIERQESRFDTIKGINERYYRFLRSVVEATRQGAHDWTNVGRGWAQRPTDIVGLYESASEALANDQARRIALRQEMLDDLAESQRESREVVRRGFGEVREAVERVQETVPAFLRARVPALRRNESEPEPVAKEA